MKQIVFLTGAMSRGGAERVISLLSQRYMQMGWRVRILMLLHDRVEYPLDPGVEVLNFSNDKVKAALDMPRLIGKVRSFMVKEKPDTAVAFMAPICLIAGFACRGLKTRLVVSERIDPALDPRNPIFRIALNNVYEKSHLTVFQTERARNYFSEKIQKNSVIIPNPVQVKAVAANRRKHRIVTAGRLMPQKNHKMLIDAFAQLHKLHSEYTLDIYGEGPLQEVLQQQIDSLELTAAVTLKGNVPNIHEQMADAEIFVLSSDFEGLSNALLEAMMMGLPCISTDCAGSDEAICNGENGLLVPVGDTKALLDAMEQLVANPDFARRLGDTAREGSSQYSVDYVIDRWRKAIEG